MSGQAEHILLLAAKVTPLEDGGAYAAAYAAVSPARQAYIDRFRRPADRRRALGAWLLLQHGLTHFGASADGIVVDALGKPQLPDGPAFSLSHSGDWAMCAVADRPVGCDIQALRPFRPQVAKRCLAPAEYTDFLSQPASERCARFYRCWTAKESFVKALGTGMRLAFSSLCLPAEAGGTLHHQGRDYGFAEFWDIPGYAAAVCAEGSCGDVALQCIPLPIP